MKVKVAVVQIMLYTTIKYEISNLRKKKKSLRKFAPLFLVIFWKFYLFSIFAHKALLLIPYCRHKLLCFSNYWCEILFTSLLTTTNVMDCLPLKTEFLKIQFLVHKFKFSTCLIIRNIYRSTTRIHTY